MIRSVILVHLCCILMCNDVTGNDVLTDPIDPIDNGSDNHIHISTNSINSTLDTLSLEDTSSTLIDDYNNATDFKWEISSIAPSPSSIESLSSHSVLINSSVLNKSIEEWEKRKTNANPSVDDIISGIIQLIGGNVKLSRPPINVKLQQINQHRQEQLMHATRINNRGPPKVSFIGPHVHHIPNIVPPSILIGPGRPSGLPLPLPPTYFGKLPVPLNIAPTKPALNIPDSDVSILLGLIKPNIKDIEIVPVIRVLPKIELSKPPLTMIEKTLSNSSVPSLPTEKVTIISSLMQNSSTITDSILQSYILSSATTKYTETFASVIPNNISSTESFTPSSSITMSQSPELSTDFDSEVSHSSTQSLSFGVITNHSDNLPTGPVTAWVPIFFPPSLRTHGFLSDDDPIIITVPDEPSIFELTVKQQMGPKAGTTMPKIEPTPVVTMSSPSFGVNINVTVTSIQSLTSETIANKTHTKTEEPEIVYGRPASINTNKPIAPSFTTNIEEEVITLSASGKMSTKNPPVVSTSRATQYGRPIVVPVEMDDVKPFVMGHGNVHHTHYSIQPSIITESGHGSVYIDGRPTPFNMKPSVGGPTIQVGSGVHVNGDNDMQNNKNGILQPQLNPSKPLIVKRPPFRPRPNVPLVRIDTCIVGDDSTCDISLNEKCQTELGISSCQCKPGFSRNSARIPCIPIVTLALAIKLDRMGDKKLLFNRNFLNSNTEDFQYLEYESLQAINSAFSLSNLARVFMGSKINRFYSVAGKTIVNATINLELNNATAAQSIKRYIQQELSRIIAIRNNNIGESQLFVEGSLNAIPRVEDINECSVSDLNDCSKFAKCVNEFGTFRCECEAGYEDKSPYDKSKSGRFCSACSPQYCSNRGECLIVNGQRQCKCKGNFIGSKCDIDAEVLGVALGGSLAALIIIVITFLCLYMWNQRWKREQQKMEAMSAASGHTFGYVTKQAGTAYRLTMDDRMRWAQIAEAIASNPGYANNYYVNPEHLSAANTSHSQHHLHHVYATPNRVQTPDALLNEDNCTLESRQYARPLRPKSRSGYTMKNGNDSVYNETEFSTREMIYSPSHLIAPRTHYSYS